MRLPQFNTDWTLFLDRDGVINYKLEDDFVTCREEFEYLPDVENTLVKLSQYFKYTLVVTNQRCIDEGLIFEEDLGLIHNQLYKDVEYLGGKIDKIYHCPHMKEANCLCRKPGTLMAEMAKNDFPDINYLQSIIVGDSLTDLEFGRKLGMTTVYIKASTQMPEANELADFVFASLADFLNLLDLDN